MSGYKDDFYVQENIIGYTGKLGENPTVYFQSRNKNGNITFGHITQEHDNKDNIGREIVLERGEKEYKQVNDWMYDMDKEKWISLSQYQKENKDKIKSVKRDKKTGVAQVAEKDGSVKTFLYTSVEICDGMIHHVSRNPFIPVKNKAEQKALANSINKFKNLKKSQEEQAAKFKEVEGLDFDDLFKTAEQKPQLPKVMSDKKEKELAKQKTDTVETKNNKGKDLSGLTKQPVRKGTTPTNQNNGTQKRVSRKRSSTNNIKL